MSKCWIYHETAEPRIVESDEAEGYYADGWADTPASFIKTTECGIDPSDEIGVQALGEAIEGVAEMANGALNLGVMKDKELKAYAMKHFDTKIKGRGQRLVNQVQGLIDGNG